MIIRIGVLLILFNTSLFSQTAENVLLILNSANPVSVDAGMYYANKRSIPQSNILTIRTTIEDAISSEDFERQINAPIAAWLARNFAQDRILYIVLTKGIPLRILGNPGHNRTITGVDSELALLYRKLAGEALPPAGSMPNPFFLADKPVSQAKQFNHADQNIYLVSRLDGYTLEDIKGLIDRGSSPSKEGKIVLDAVNSRTMETSDILGKMGQADRVLQENIEQALQNNRLALGYYSWGSKDPVSRKNYGSLKFASGALAAMYSGPDGRTFKKPAEEQTPAKTGASPISAADLIRDGITGIAAPISEPFAGGFIRPDILFPAYFSGFNLVESYYMAMPSISRETVVIGDPLCAPFRTKSMLAKDLDKGFDLDTELPADFGMRRYKSLLATASKQPGIHPETIKLILRAESRMTRQNLAGAREALEEAVALDDQLPAPHWTLSTLYEAAQEYDKAIAQYRRILELAPDHALALNNLAFALAARKNSVAEAIPLAEKAYTLSGRSPIVADTLGWIYHLAGQSDKATKLLEEASRAGTKNPDIYLHFAIISEEAGNTLAAQVALQRALDINPQIEQREEVKALRSKLNPPSEDPR